MQDTMRTFGQTHKTILFEEFSHGTDDEAKSLFSLMEGLPKEKKVTDQTLLRAIDEELTVHSYKEFLKKFSPKVYEYINMVNGKPVFSYTMDKEKAEKNNGRLVSIADHDFFKMIDDMYTQKGSKNKSNMDFDENRVKAILMPSTQMEDIYDMRRKLRTLAINYAKAKEAGQDARPYAEAIYDCREEISEKYDENPLPKLAQAINNAKKKIETVNEQIKALEAVPDGIAPVLTSGRLAFDKNGHLEVLAVEPDAGKNKAQSDRAAIEANAVGEVLALVQADVQESETLDDFSKELVIAAYAPMEATKEEESKDLPALRQELEDQEELLNVYQDVYAQAQDAFIKALSDITQKMLGVRVFFDHATKKGGLEGELPGGLIIANCGINKFMDRDSNRQRLKDLMNHLGHERKNAKVWFAILPSVNPGKDEGDSDKKAFKASMSEEDLMTKPLNKKGQATSKKAAPQKVGTDLPTAGEFLEMMDKSGIVTVFSFTPAPANTFAGLSAKGVEEMEEKLKDYDYPHAVFAYPNFTVMNKGTLTLDDNVTLDVPAIYVSAAYVACGMLVASQQPDILESKGLGSRLVNGQVCTRVDLEDPELLRTMTTKFNRELAYSWDSEIIPAIIKNNFGFVFCGDYKKKPGKDEEYKNSYLLLARTMGRRGSKYLPVYDVLTQDFVNAYLRNSYFKGDAMFTEDFDMFMKDVEEWKKEAGRDNNANKINLPLRNGEDIIKVMEDGEPVLQINLKSGKNSFKPKVITKSQEDK